MDKRNRRLRRSRKARSLQVRLGMYRLRVHRTPRRYRDACWLGSDTWRRRVVHESDSWLGEFILTLVRAIR